MVKHHDVHVRGDVGWPAQLRCFIDAVLDDA